MTQDIKILRQLAAEYSAIANDERNITNQKLHRAVNDLKEIRPIVLIGAIPWQEMNFDGSLDLKCEDKYFCTVEEHLRRTLFQWRYFPADMVVPPYLGVRKVVHSTGIGVEVKEETVRGKSGDSVASHRYENQFKTLSDLDKLHFDQIEYDERQTKQNHEMLSNAVGDIIDTKIIGHDTGYGLGCITWDIIATLMGVDDLLYNLIDEPDFMHKLVSKLTDIYIDQVCQYEKLNLFNGEAMSVQNSATLSDDLDKNPYDPQNTTAKNMWGRGLAQILETVSPEMHGEFDIDYMIKAMEPFGLVYYGCCEALDKKVDIISRIKNLRKISISPWADVATGAEAIGKRYVLSAKPNPASVANGALNLENVRDEVKKILSATRQNGCATEIVLKDISTVDARPQNLMEWEKLVMELVEE